MSEHKKSSILRRLSFRRRRERARYPAAEDESEHVVSSPPSSSSTTTVSRSTSTTSLETTTPASEQRAVRSNQVSECPSPMSSLAPPPTEAADHCQEGIGIVNVDDTRGGTCATATNRNRALEDSPQGSPLPEEAQRALQQVLLSNLECPVCYQPMVPPIGQCGNGHSVCADCQRRLLHCPTCRGTFLAATNVALNAIAGAVLLPCRHRAAGCCQLLHLADKARHEQRCPHREYSCPHCVWKGALDSLLLHAFSKHTDAVVLVSLNQHSDIGYTYCRSQPIETNKADVGVNRVSKTLLLVETADKKNAAPARSARAIFRFHLRFDSTRVVLQAALQLVGPPHLSRLFRYKVTLSSEDGSFRLSAWSEASSQDVDEAVSGGRVLKVDGASFQHFINSEGRFNVRLKVVVCSLPRLNPCDADDRT